MRPFDSDFDDLDDFDDSGYPSVRAIRHMVNERQRDELRLRGRKRGRPFAKDRWRNEDWNDEEDVEDYDFDDYSTDEFDTH